MKVEWRTIIGASTFLGLLCASYWIAVYYHGHPSEAAGIVMLGFGFAAYGMLGGYLFLQYRRRKGIPRPEDSFDATSADGAGLIGYFPSASIWPAAMGLAWIFGAAALVWGLWYLIIAGIIFAGAVLGWVIESDHSEQIEHGLIGDTEGTTVAGTGTGHWLALRLRPRRSLRLGSKE